MSPKFNQQLRPEKNNNNNFVFSIPGQSHHNKHFDRAKQKTIDGKYFRFREQRALRCLVIAVRLDRKDKSKCLV
jgi:hypothetical protein